MSRAMSIASKHSGMHGCPDTRISSNPIVSSDIFKIQSGRIFFSKYPEIIGHILILWQIGELDERNRRKRTADYTLDVESILRYFDNALSNQKHNTPQITEVKRFQKKHSFLFRRSYQNELRTIKKRI
ncbi:MAG: hypothetical protein WHS82_05505 [Candidatus Methanosuratincola sp.]